MSPQTFEQIQIHIYITNMYVTPDCTFSDLSTFADKFTEFAAPVLGNSSSIVCGDFNSCDYSFLLSLGHKNMVNFSTRLDNTLDFAFTNEPGIYEALKRATLLNSDHCIVHISPKVYGKLYKKALAYLSRKVQYRCYSQENILHLRSMLIETDWDIFADEVLDNTITNITSYLRFCLDICCPTETIYMRFDRLSSPHLKRLQREKERLYKARDHSGIKRLNCLIKSDIQRMNTIYNKKFLSCKSSSNIWKLFKELTGEIQMTSQTRSDVCALNKSFIRRQANFTLPNVQNQVDSCFPGFNTNDVFKCLKSLNPSQSLGPDGVSSIIFRKCADILYHPLTDTFGVPQGAVLSPFLFSFFSHDLPYSVEPNFIKYADNLTISIPLNSSLDCSKLNEFLSEVSLKLNPSKCQTVDFGLRRKEDLCELLKSRDTCCVNGISAESKSGVNYLGLRSTPDFCWSFHILLTCKKIFRLTYYVKKLGLSGITQVLLLQLIIPAFHRFFYVVPH
ncbi:unnamed protein product [Heterobilharzia americana]|nr:unnamed protein product [Heterobilharzia americana]